METEVDKFLSGVYMGSFVFDQYYDKATNESVRSLIKEIMDSFKRHEKACKRMTDEAHLTFMENMSLYLEKIKLLKVKNDLDLCKEMLKAMVMGITSSIEFLHEHKDLDGSEKKIIEGILSDYDNQMKKIILVMKQL